MEEVREKVQTLDFTQDDLKPTADFPISFPLVGGLVVSGTVTLRLLSADDLEEIRAKYMRKKSSYQPNPEMGNRLEKVEFLDGDETAYNHEVWDRCIVGWDLTDKDGRVLECSTEKKVKVMSGSAAFSSKVSDYLVKMRADLKVQQEEASKNVNTSRGGG